MTTTAPPTAACPACAAPRRPGARYCVGCGASLSAAEPATTPIALPWLAPAALPAPPPPRRRSHAGVVTAALLVAVLAVAATVAVVLHPPSALTAPTPAAAAPAPSAPADPAAELRRQAGADAPAAQAALGSWLPQLSSKRAGTTDAAAVLADHRQLRARFPQALLVWSGDYTSFRGDDFWVTLLDRPSSTAAAANAWCTGAGLDSDHCYAKRLSRSGGPTGNTVERSDGGTAGTSGTTATTATAGAEPVVGWSGWAPGAKGYGTARPSELNANGDPTSYIEGVTWRSWGGPTATGRGTAGWYGPDQFASDTVLIPAVVIASDLGDCHGRLAYRKVSWYFPSKGETAADAGSGYDHICSTY